MRTLKEIENKYPWVTFQNSPVKIKIVPEC